MVRKEKIMDKDKYIIELERQYNLLFDYMWSKGSIPYINFLRKKKIITSPLSQKKFKPYTTRINTNVNKCE